MVSVCVGFLGLEVIIGLLEHGSVEVFFFVRRHFGISGVLLEVGTFTLRLWVRIHHLRASNSDSRNCG